MDDGTPDLERLRRLNAPFPGGTDALPKYEGAGFVVGIGSPDVNINATVAHDVTLADYVTLNPQAALSGEVSVKEAATVGSAAVVRQGLSIGESATVGAGAAVLRDIPSGETWVGVPARVLYPSSDETD